MLARGHLQVHSLALAETTALQHERETVAGGSKATVVHMKGYAFALIAFYGHSSIGLRGANISCFRKLGGL
eukprot:4981312-Pyramimonas_sp.AAC.1